ncbi:Uncharacterized protein APZ42_014586 [Daphnia magna]|uniref:Uncharacterized protein n=1 Tax=Daphnia magna TaxID=35525 RepID=A0A162PQK8_9CRUS|nr:Uncharacterized protein APZ42_014586 [Daphnia magna]
MRYTYINSLFRIDAFVIEPVKKIDFFFQVTHTQKHTRVLMSRVAPFWLGRVVSPCQM